MRLPFDVKIALEEIPGAPPLLQAATTWDRATDLAVCVGPEGGWTDGERAAMTTSGWLPASLGSTVLRAETAAIAAAAVLNQAVLDNHSYGM